MPRSSAAPIVAAQKAHRQSAHVRAIHRVAASLQRSRSESREADSTKQETPDRGWSEVSPLTTWRNRKARAANAQSDIRGH